MKRAWIFVASLWLLLTGSGCGGGGIGIASSDGGPVGSGLSASISGNVTSVAEGTSAADATSGGAAAVPVVQVSIDEVTGSASTTDADGNFELTGDFSGTLTLRFKTAAYAVTEQVDVPAGSTIVLQDLRLAPRTVQMGAVRQLGFLGAVAHTDCAAGSILVDDRRPKANQFMVRLTASTDIVDGSGNALACAAIRTGQQVVVRGTIQLSDQTMVATAMVVGPQATDQVQLTGRIIKNDCTAGVLMMADPAGKSGGQGMSGMSSMPGMAGILERSRLRLSQTTKIADSSGRTLRCQDLNVGDRIEVEGAVNNTNNPGIIDAQTVKRLPA
ncbi:MAG: hypothetical protein H6Q33_2081 [Deltaproteobacteria bacterium]|nr:hypothetical protein [Deltaproteobacteria bacterium]